MLPILTCVSNVQVTQETPRPPTVNSTSVPLSSKRPLVASFLSSSVTCNKTGNRIEVLSNNAITSTETKSKGNSAMPTSLIRSFSVNRIPAQTKANYIPKGQYDVAASGQQTSDIQTKPENNEEFIRMY